MEESRLMEERGKRVEGKKKEEAFETHIISGLGNSNRRSDLSGSSSVNDSVINNQVSNDADGIVKSSLGLVDDLFRFNPTKQRKGQLSRTRLSLVVTFFSSRTTHHLVRSPDEHGNSSGVGALLDDQHLVLGRSERDLSNDSSSTQLLGGEILEPRDDSTLGGDGDELRSKSGKQR